MQSLMKLVRDVLVWAVLLSRPLQMGVARNLDSTGSCSSCCGGTFSGLQSELDYFNITLDKLTVGKAYLKVNAVQAVRVASMIPCDDRIGQNCILGLCLWSVRNSVTCRAFICRMEYLSLIQGWLLSCVDTHAFGGPAILT